MAPGKPNPLPERSREELQRLLQESLRKERPRVLRFALLLVLLGVALVLGVLWVFSPRAEPALVIVVAFDDVTVSGKETTLRGQLDAPGEPGATLGGKDMLFVDGQVVLTPGQAPREVPARTGPHGEVACT